MVTDPGAAKQFYSSLFGWDIQDGPPEAGGYAMCLLNGRPVTAISPKAQDNPFPNVWSTYLASDDLDASVAKAKEAGGQFMMEPMDVMTAGRLAFGMDPTGAPYGIWQGGDHVGVGIFNEPGTLVWNELMTRDHEGAKAFYGGVFGYSYDEMADVSLARGTPTPRSSAPVTARSSAAWACSTPARPLRSPQAGRHTSWWRTATHRSARLPRSALTWSANRSTPRSAGWQP